MNNLLEPILHSTLLPELAAELQAAVQAEQKQRAQFVEELTPEMKAEFIQGEVFLHSPTRALHLEITANLFVALRTYSIRMKLGRVFCEKCLISLTRNDYEPDIVYFGPEKAAAFTPEQMRFPAPDLIAEVLSKSTEHFDRGVKFEDYGTHGVGEYWIIDPDSRTVEQYLLPAGQKAYHLHEKLTHGTLRAKSLPGFEMALETIFGESAESPTAPG